MKRTLGLVVVVALFAACRSYPAPTDRVSVAESAIGQAQGAGAMSVPSAALSLKLAQEEVQKAKQLMQDGDNQRAESMLERAKVDAEVAFSPAREAQAKAEAQQSLEQLKALKK